MVPPGYKGRLAKMLTSAKITWTTYHYISIKKTWYPKLKRFFFIANYILSRVFRGFEQLCSSIWRRVIACGEMPPKVVLEGAKFWSIFGLWAIIFAPDMLESHSRAPKMRILALFPKTSWAKIIAQWVVVQGQVKVAKKVKTPPLSAVPQRTPNRKQKSFFYQFQAEDLLNPWMVWIAL